MAEKRSFRVTRGHCLGAGRGDVADGTVLTIPVDLSPAEAASKLALGYIEEIVVSEENEKQDGAAGTKAPTSKATSGQVETGDPTPEHGDPAPARPSKSGRKKPRSKK